MKTSSLLFSILAIFPGAAAQAEVADSSPAGFTVKHILEKHGGNINVESAPGTGTRFTLWWPRVYIVSEAFATSLDRRGELLPEKSRLTG